MIYKVKKNMAPRMNWIQLQTGASRRGRMDITKRRWSNKIQLLYDTVDINIRKEIKIWVFKRRIKTWIRNNIDVFGDE